VQCEEEYVVQVGDTLASIAAETLNDPLAYPALMVLANAAPDDEYANIDDPNVIEEGWTICIPSEEDLPDLLAQGGPVIQAIARSAGIEPPPPLEETLWARWLPPNFQKTGH
jgi:hypothetical protein